MIYKNFLNYLILLSSIKYIKYAKAENQCTSNLDCAKFNTDVDSHVCIRFDGQTDFVCYLDSEAYCDTDATCQKYNPNLKFCYVPPWITNKNSQKQCFTIHKAGGSCVEDIHCEDGLVCSSNVCVTPTGNINAKPGANNNSNTNANTNAKSSNNTTKANSNNNSTSNSNSLELDDDDITGKKKEPIEILGLPLWLCIVLVTVPVIFGIAVLWGLSIGRRSYREEEERKRARVALRNNKDELEMNYKGNSTEKLLTQSSSDLKDVKEDMLQSYLNNSNRKNSSSNVGSTTSSNSTIGNNLTGVTVENKLHNKSSQQTLEVPKQRKPRKSNASATSTSSIPPKPKKPKSIVNSEYSDTNSHKSLLNAGGALGMSAAESGIYSSYFGGGGAASTVSSSYFGQPLASVPPATDPAMNTYYYQQMMAAQAQAQAAQAQTYMNTYYMDNTMGAMPTVDMMQYQQMYGMAAAGYPGYATSDAASITTTEKKHKRKGGK